MCSGLTQWWELSVCQLHGPQTMFGELTVRAAALAGLAELPQLQFV